MSLEKIKELIEQGKLKFMNFGSSCQYISPPSNLDLQEQYQVVATARGKDGIAQVISPFGTHSLKEIPNLYSRDSRFNEMTLVRTCRDKSKDYSIRIIYEGKEIKINELDNLTLGKYLVQNSHFEKSETVWSDEITSLILDINYDINIKIKNPDKIEKILITGPTA